MTLKELIHTYKWETISTQFLECYPEAEKDLEGYKMVFEKLKAMEQQLIAMAIIISKEEDVTDDDQFIDVAGIHTHPKNIEENYPQGIEFLPWRQWLGMDIHTDSLANFSEQEIIVHCLYEMTFEGFNEENIKFDE